MLNRKVRRSSFSMLSEAKRIESDLLINVVPKTARLTAIVSSRLTRLYALDRKRQVIRAWKRAPVSTAFRSEDPQTLAVDLDLPCGSLFNGVRCLKMSLASTFFRIALRLPGNSVHCKSRS